MNTQTYPCKACNMDEGSPICLQDSRCLVAAHAAPPAAMPEPWMPIESAPKDGRKIILTYRNANDKPRTVMAVWVTDEEAAESDEDGVGLGAGWYESIDNWDDYSQVAIHAGEPTHWMPLPAAPGATPPAPPLDGHGGNLDAADWGTPHDVSGAPWPVPDGMVMVPREPTPEMIAAADQSDKEYSLRSFGPGTVLAQSGYDHWVAMIAASPPAAPAPVDPTMTREELVAAAESIGMRMPAPIVREPLTDEQLEEIVAATGHGSALFDFARAIEQAHGIGGGNG